MKHLQKGKKDKEGTILRRSTSETTIFSKLGHAVTSSQKVRILIAITLSAFGIALFTSSATAEKPIPGIKYTHAYKSLKNYVSFLQARRDKATSTASKLMYKQTLTTRRTNAYTKVNLLLRQTLTRLARKDDSWERRQVQRIRRARNQQVRELRSDQNSQVRGLRSRQAAEIGRVQDRYRSGINRLVSQRSKLQKQLLKTTDSTKRATLIRQIKQVQSRINDLSDARQDDIDDVKDRYAARTSAVNDLFNAKVSRTKARARAQVAEAGRAWRKTFRIQRRAALTRSDTQRGFVRELSTRGLGYIDSMPPLPPPPVP